MKYIIELEQIEGTDLYKAKGAKTLVFDENGMRNILKPYPVKTVQRIETYTNARVAYEDYIDEREKMIEQYSGGITYRGYLAMIMDFVRWLSEEVEVEDGKI